MTATITCLWSRETVTADDAAARDRNVLAMRERANRETLRANIDRARHAFGVAPIGDTELLSTIRTLAESALCPVRVTAPTGETYETPQ